jgi:aryl-alcohol dehydrogenase-like predicted oxidoreductase
VSHLVLGTAQWGDPYGATNTQGRLSDADIEEIVAIARASGITDVDTASGYGDAEHRLRPFARDFRITTKLMGASPVEEQARPSLAALAVDAVDTILVHDWDALSQGQRESTVDGLGRLVDAGVSERVGVSVYDAEGIRSARAVFGERGTRLGALQVPANPIDRRLDDSHDLLELAAEGVHVVVRSVFLQGVLLSSVNELSSHPDVRQFVKVVDGRPVGRVDACLAHARALPWATHVVVGVTNANELAAVCHAWKSTEPKLLPGQLASSDRKLLDPRLW